MSVSNCVVVKLLFFNKIAATGSLNDLSMNVWSPSPSVKNHSPKVMYTIKMVIFVYKIVYQIIFILN